MKLKQRLLAFLCSAQLHFRHEFFWSAFFDKKLSRREIDPTNFFQALIAPRPPGRVPA